MTSEAWSVVGSCECGAVQVKQRRPGGLMAFRCHCSTCRRVYEKDPVTKGVYATPSIDWTCNIKAEGPVVWQHSCGFCGPIPSGACLKRGTCERCNTPVMSRGMGPMCAFGFANYECINRGLPDSEKIQPEVNLWYSSGHKEGE